MAQSQPKRMPPPEKVLFSEAADPGFASPRFWAQLVSYRPVIMLGALWMVLVSIAAVAYSRLMFTEPPAPETVATEVPSPTSSLPSSHQDQMQADVAALESSLNFDSTTSKTNSGVPLWSIGLLIGTCALGSWLVSYQVTAPPKTHSRRRRVKSRTTQSTKMGGTGKQRSLSGPKRLKPYSPDSDQVLIPGFQADALEMPEGTVLPSVTSAPSDSSNPPVSPPPVAPEPQPEVTILAQEELTPLDWPDGSLAHNLDVRQRRSLSSYL
jgi:hypothetical protein